MLPDQPTMHFRDRWHPYVWFAVCFILVWAGGVTAAVLQEVLRYARYVRSHGSWPFGDDVVPLSRTFEGDVSDIAVFATFGLGILAAVLISLMRKRAELVLDQTHVADRPVLGRVRRFPYSNMRRLRGLRTLGNHSYLFVAETQRGKFRFGRSVERWPSFLAELWRRSPQMEVRLPDQLLRRLRSMRDGKSPSVVLPATISEPLRYRFFTLYAPQLVPCCFGLVMSSIGLPLMKAPWEAFVFFYFFLGGTAAVCALQYRLKYSRYRFALFPERLEFEDHRGTVVQMPWGDIVEYDIDGGSGGGFVTIHAVNASVMFRRELDGWEWLDQALKDASEAIDRQIFA